MGRDALDLLLAAAGDEIARRVLADLPAIVRAELRAALAEQGEGLRPLSEIDGIKADAARRRVERDPDLARLGIRVGRRLLFRASEVTALRAGRARNGAPSAGATARRRLRALDGGR